MTTELHLDITDKSGIRTGVPRAFKFADGPVCLGRSKRNDVIFGDHRVSRIHLVVDRNEAGWRLTCKGRMEPAVVNADTVSEGETHPLADGDVIRVGKCDIRVHIVDAGARPALRETPVDRTEEFHPAAPKAAAHSMDSTDPLW